MSEQIAERYKVVKLLDPASVTADANGTAVEIGAEYEEDAMAVLQLGAASGTSPTCDVTIQASATQGGTYTTIGTFSQLSGTDDNKVAAIPVKLNTSARRWVRASVDVGGTSPDYLLGVTLLVRRSVAKNANNSATAA